MRSSGPHPTSDLGYALFNLEESCCTIEMRYCSAFQCTWALSSNINETSWHFGSTLQSGFQNFTFENFAVDWRFSTNSINMQHWKRAMGDCSLVLGGVSGTQTTFPTASDRPSKVVSESWEKIVVTWGTRFSILNILDAPLKCAIAVPSSALGSWVPT